MDKIHDEGLSMRTRDRIIALHKRGLANAEIARIVGVSRQYVWAVLNPKERKHNLSAVVRSALEETGIAPMSITGVAAMLGVHPNTIRRWSDKGLIPCFRLGPRQDRKFERQRVMETMHKGIQ
jgi:excisionase family DNA binding protein